MMKNKQQDIKTLDGMGDWSAMRNWELQNHIASYFEKFANSIDHVYHNQHFSHYNNAKCHRCNAAAFPATWFQWHNIAFDMVCCTGWKGGESICHPEIILYFNGWGRVQRATLSQLLDWFPPSWCDLSALMMMNRVLKGYLPCIWDLRQGQYIQLLI